MTETISSKARSRSKSSGATKFVLKRPRSSMFDASTRAQRVTPLAVRYGIYPRELEVDMLEAAVAEPIGPIESNHRAEMRHTPIRNTPTRQTPIRNTTRTPQGVNSPEQGDVVPVARRSRRNRTQVGSYKVKKSAFMQCNETHLCFFRYNLRHSLKGRSTENMRIKIFFPIF